MNKDKLLLVNANALHIPLANKSIQTCVTSPPYWGLRDYGTAIWIDGDNPACEHLQSRNAGEETSTLEGGQKTNSHNQEPYKSYCRKCGAIRIDNQLGLEKTPEEYVENMVKVFREVWRVLRDDGTLWLNLGDSYANKGVSDSSKVGGFTGDRIRKGAKGIMDSRPREIPQGLKIKDLVGIPWRVAFALQAEGWYLRNDIIWHKPNPMPESVKDRCTKSHEYIFLLSKNKKYYYDAEAVKEPVTGNAHSKHSKGNKLDPPKGNEGRHKDWHKLTPDLVEFRNKRTVWTITTKLYKGAHYATFPPELPEICIKAGSAEGDTVLDPFVGSGTTCMVARILGRYSVGLDLSTNYLADNARIRLELDKLDKWMKGKNDKNGEILLNDLPMFSEVNYD